jgi:Ca2+-binding EF-hand superfamily protein
MAVSNYPSVSATMDDNGDGLIDENEAYRKLGQVYTPSFDFFKYDVNGDGQLSFEEMSNIS